MKNKKLEEIVVEYLTCKDESLKKELKEKLLELDYKQHELEYLDKLYFDLDKLEVPDPGPRLNKNFYSALDVQISQLKQEKNWYQNLLHTFSIYNNRPFIKFAYALILIFLGWSIGFWQSSSPSYNKELKAMANEIYNMKVMMTLSLLNQSSPDEKLLGIQKAGMLTDIDTQVILALLETLNNDPNAGVRLETITVLEKFGFHPLVRQGLVRAISQQESSMVQLYLADIMVRLQEKNAVEPFRKLLNRKNLNENVRDKIEKSILVLI
jgi:hypothetical protein